MEYLLLDQQSVELSWWRKHFGTDMLVATWLITIGCGIYFFVVLPFVVAEPWRFDKWCELIASFIFVLGSFYLVYAVYPVQLVRMASAPPRKLTWCERWFTSNKMLIGTQLYNVGMLFYLAEGAVNMISPPPDDPPGAALSVVIGVLAFMPLLYLFTLTSMDENMTKNDGAGSTFVWDCCLRGCLKCCCCGCCMDWFKKHLGSDMIFLLWFFLVFLGLGLVGVVPMAILDPDDSDHLCGPISCFWNAAVLVPFLGGMSLFLKASYPGKQAGSIFFGDYPMELAYEQLVEEEATPKSTQTGDITFVRTPATDVGQLSITVSVMQRDLGSVQSRLDQVERALATITTLPDATQSAEETTATKAAAEMVIKGYNTKDTEVVKASLAPSVKLGNNKGLGPPKPMPTEKIIGALKGVMFDSFGFSFVEPAISINGTQAVIDTKLSIDTTLPAWEAASGKPAPFPPVPVKEMFGGKDMIPAQMTLETDTTGKVTSIYWHLGPGAEKGKSAQPLATTTLNYHYHT